jgi:hypothetical protein
MAIEAPISKFKKHNILIYIAGCIILAGWFGYDGYINKNFIKEHTDENGRADGTLVFNQKSPPFFIAAALIFGVYFAMVRTKKLLADENELIISNNKRIQYDSIEKIDKTWFESKGYFVITCKDKNGKETNHKISDRAYDRIDKILNLLVEKIS